MNCEYCGYYYKEEDDSVPRCHFEPRAPGEEAQHRASFLRVRSSDD